MKKLIRQYEEKNRIIQEIQKNLRMGHQRNSKSKLKNQKFNKSFGIDLPTIHLKHEYSPKSHHKNNDRKQEIVSNQYKQDIKYLTKKQPNKPWIQTISFQADEHISKPRILLSHRTTLINFMRSTQRSQASNQTEDQNDKNQIFLSPSKCLSLSKQKRIKLSKISGLIQQQQKQSQHDEQEDLSTKYSKKVMQQILSSQMKQKQQKQPTIIKKMKQIQNPHNFYSMNTIDLVERSHRRSKSKRNGNKRSCSPWGSQKEGQQLVEIWHPDL